MMADGSSVRGLSDVMMTWSLSSSAMAPIRGRLAESRSPPQPNTVMSRRGTQLAQGGQGVQQRVRSVRVIDENLERPALGDTFETPGHLRRGGEIGHGFAQVEAAGDRGGESGEAVVNVEAPDQRQAHEQFSLAHFELVVRAVEIKPHVRRAVVGCGAQPVTDRLQPGIEPRHEPPPVGIVEVDDGGGLLVPVTGRNRLEERFLGLEVVFHRLMEVEVVLGQIGKDGGVEFDGVDAPLDEGV